MSITVLEEQFQHQLEVWLASPLGTETPAPGWVDVVPSTRPDLGLTRHHLTPADPPRPLPDLEVVGAWEKAEPSEEGSQPETEGPDPATKLREALAELGVARHAQDWFVSAVETVGALTQGHDLTGPSSVQHAEETSVGAPDRAELVAAESEVLDRFGALVTLRSHLEAAMVRTAGQLSVRTGRILLADRGAMSPQELSPTARERWLSRARTSATAEITCFTGLGPGEAADLVNLATSPAAVARTVTSSMDNGVSPWALARPYFRASAGLAHEDAAHVATVLFGDDPATAAEERLDTDGQVKDEPWNHKEFRKALDREIQAVRSRDPAAAREAREQARRRRDIRVRAHSDGTGQVVINGTAAQAVAVNDRMERAARRARAAGDERTLGQLRSDLAMSLLLHSTLNLPNLPVDPDLVTTEHTDQMMKVLLALPSAVLNVVVPYAAFLHSPNQPLPPFVTAPARAADSSATPDGPADATDDAPGAAAPDTPDGADVAPSPQAGSTATSSQTADTAPSSQTADTATTSQTGNKAPSSQTAGAATSSSVAHGSAVPTDEGDSCPGCRREAAIRKTRETVSQILNHGGDLHTTREAAAAGLYSPPPETLLVGEALGALPYFLTVDEIRDLALQPGTELSRLLVDPADGRCIERSIGTYEPDGVMRAQIHAADVTCRAPGCVQHAGYTQLDHVLEWPEGETSEVNLQSAHQGHHHLMTCKIWKAVMDPTDRSVTWRTLLSRIYRTRVHDYRQYTRLYTDAVARVEARSRAVLEDPSVPDTSKVHAHSDAVDQAVIEALAWRDPGQPLAAGDDQAGQEGYAAWPTTILSHTTADGQRRTGPAPEVLEAERRRQQDSAKAVRDEDRS